MKKLNLLGNKYGRLTVVEAVKNHGRIKWKCVCVCGGETVTTSYALKGGKTKSCGCLSIEKCSARAIKRNAIHGHNKTGLESKTHSSWASMLSRCRDKKHNSYKYYGGRGIKVCERWNEFKFFLEDMGERPDGTSLDRIDTNGDYDPLNCKWSTRSEQQRNRRDSHNITFNGVTKHLHEWAIDLGITYGGLWQRVNKLGGVAAISMGGKK